jgi:hypothetical protein
MFFNRFLPTLAIIHRPTFIVKHSNGPLLINMIVIGSLYVQTQDARIKVRRSGQVWQGAGL